MTNGSWCTTSSLNVCFYRNQGVIVTLHGNQAWDGRTVRC